MLPACSRSVWPPSRVERVVASGVEGLLTHAVEEFTITIITIVIIIITTTIIYYYYRLESLPGERVSALGADGRAWFRFLLGFQARNSDVGSSRRQCSFKMWSTVRLQQCQKFAMKLLQPEDLSSSRVPYTRSV